MDILSTILGCQSLKHISLFGLPSSSIVSVRQEILVRCSLQTLCLSSGLRNPFAPHEAIRLLRSDVCRTLQVLTLNTGDCDWLSQELMPLSLRVLQIGANLSGWQHAINVAAHLPRLESIIINMKERTEGLILPDLVSLYQIYHGNYSSFQTLKSIQLVAPVLPPEPLLASLTLNHPSPQRQMEFCRKQMTCSLTSATHTPAPRIISSLLEGATAFLEHTTNSPDIERPGLDLRTYSVSPDSAWNTQFITLSG